MLLSRPLLLLLTMIVTLAVTSNLLAQRKTDKAEAERLAKAELKLPTDQEIDLAIERGIAFLLQSQNPDGSWGSATKTKGLNIYAPIPGSHHAFRAAVTSLCISALIEFDSDDPKINAALDRAEKWMSKNLPRVKRADATAIYNNWAHTYSIQALVRMLRRKPNDVDRRKHVLSLLRGQIKCLERYEGIDGGWGYYDFDHHTRRPATSPISFITAAALVALHEAQAAGVDVPEKMIRRAKASLMRQRLPDGAYLYGEYLKWKPRRGINRPAGSLGRSQACNTALRLWNEPVITEDAIRESLDRLIARNGWLDIGRKRPVPHESWFQVAGYFFYFGHYYAATATELLPEKDKGARAKALAGILVPLQEKDGSWWDYPLYNYHQPYGTSFAVMSLLRYTGSAQR